MSFLNIDQLLHGSFAFEIRFSTKMILLERGKLAEFSKELDGRFTMKDYSDTQIQYSGDKDAQARIELDKIIVGCGNCSAASFADSVKKFVPLAVEKFGFNKPNRLGYRVTAISKRKSIQEACNEYFSLTALKKENVDNVGSLMGYKIGTTIRMSDNMVCNIVLSPAMRRNIVINPKASKQTDEFGIMVDIDIFREQNLDGKEEVKDFIDKATRNLQDKIYPMMETVR